jgi:hypothetical protein
MRHSTCQVGGTFFRKRLQDIAGAYVSSHTMLNETVTATVTARTQCEAYVARLVESSRITPPGCSSNSSNGVDRVFTNNFIDMELVRLTPAVCITCCVLHDDMHQDRSY